MDHPTRSAEASRLTDQDGIELATEHWWTPGAPARIVIVHGYAEHKGRYRGLVDDLTGAGYSCHLLDLRGHGASGGVRGHVSRFEEYRTDLDGFLAEIRTLAATFDPTVPLILLGHSLGGLIALDYVAHHPQAFAALAVSSPFLAPAFAIPFLKRTFLPLAAGIAPTFAVESGLDPRGLSHDPQVVAEYEADPKVFSTVTLGWFRAVEAAQKEVFEAAGSIRLPILVLLGEADPIADPKRSRDFFARLGSANRRLVTYPGLFHEVFNELERAQVVGDLLAWLKGLQPEAAS